MATVNRVLNIFLNADGEMRRQSASSLVPNGDLRDLQHQQDQFDQNNSHQQLIPLEIAQQSTGQQSPNTINNIGEEIVVNQSTNMKKYQFFSGETNCVIDENMEEVAQSLHTLNKGDSANNVGISHLTMNNKKTMM